MPSEPASPDDKRWTYDLKIQGQHLAVQFRNDTVVRWEAILDGAGWWRDHPVDVSRSQRLAIERYLRSHSETSPTDAFSMYRQCPRIGMTFEMVRVSLGVPSSIRRPDPTLPENTTWFYMKGREGQSLVVHFGSGRVVGWLYSAGFLSRWVPDSL
jgi:hypothetical protein